MLQGYDAVPCIDPHQIEEILRFDKLTKFVVYKLATEAYFKVILEVLEGMKPFRFWHAPLRKMLFYFFGEQRRFICLENFAGVVKMRYTGPFAMDD